MTAPVLTTDRLTLRLPHQQDFEACAAFYASDRSVFVGGPKSRDDAWRSFALMVGHWTLRGFGLFAVVPHGRDAAVGLIGAWFPEGWPEKEIGWHLWSADLEGTGIAHEAAHAARAWAYDGLGWTTAVSYLWRANTRSARLAERLGAVLDGQAPTPRGMPCLVYRHPGPEALQ